MIFCDFDVLFLHLENLNLFGVEIMRCFKTLDLSLEWDCEIFIKNVESMYVQKMYISSYLRRCIAKDIINATFRKICG